MVSDEDVTPPDRAFSLLSEPTRLNILRGLFEAGEPTSFSALRERVGNPDSGLFNHHLDALVGHYVRKGENGYTLTQAGREVVRAVLAGSLTERPRLEPGPIDGHCVECGGTLVARYEEHGIVECADCGATVLWNEFPPAGLADRDAAEFARALDRWTQHRFRLAVDGVCPNCATEMSVELPDADPGGDAGDDRLATHHRCPNCEYEARVPLFGHVIGHPAVISLFYEQGVDVTDLPYWELRDLADDYSETILSGDPWRARVTVETGGSRLRLTLAGDLSVVDVDRPDLSE